MTGLNQNHLDNSEIKNRLEDIDNITELIDLLVEKFGWSQEQVNCGFRARFHCEYCDKYLLESYEAYDQWQIDHIIPQSTFKKGFDINSYLNMAVSCKLCNFIKGNWDGLETLPISSVSRINAIFEAQKFIYIWRSKKMERFKEMKSHINRYLINEELLLKYNT